MAVRVLDLPTHIGDVPVIFTLGNVLTVTVAVEVAVHPLALVTVTVYVVVEGGLTVILAVICPPDQAYDVPPVAVRVVD